MSDIAAEQTAIRRVLLANGYTPLANGITAPEATKRGSGLWRGEVIHPADPGLRWAEIEQKNKQTGEVTKRMSLTVRQARARVPLSHLTLTNNVTQGTAASLLREALVKIERDPMLRTILTTHDECVCMVREADAEEGAARLSAIMKAVPPWAEGLPISADSVTHRWYSKAIE